MKVLFTPQSQICVVIDEDEDEILLEPLDGDEDDRFWVSLANPGLIFDPTDNEVERTRG